MEIKRLENYVNQHGYTGWKCLECGDTWSIPGDHPGECPQCSSQRFEEIRPEDV